MQLPGLSESAPSFPCRRPCRLTPLAPILAAAIAAFPPPGNTAVTRDIRVNQVGFFGAGPKSAAVVGAASDDFLLLSSNLADTVFRGKLGEEARWEPSQEMARIADFGAFTAPGRYVLAIPGLGVSNAFAIGSPAQLDLARASLRAFYYQRASITLEKAFAGKWARASGHPDRRVYIHPSAATAARPAESLIPSPRGWYDAGDYGKYVVNSGISTYTLLALYRHFPAHFDTLKLNIPESGDGVPDLLDEVLWNLRWMMSMQDQDGGAYHKLTTAEFSGMVMPSADLQKRYVVQKSVTATLNLAAVAACASRVFRKFDRQLPGFADSALAVSRKAWDWARANPAAFYRQAEMNKVHLPAVNTGEYGDGNAGDEFQWAGVELHLATGADSFYLAAYPTAGTSAGTTVGALPVRIGAPGWPSVAALAFYSMADEGGPGGGASPAVPVHPLIDLATVRQRIVEAARLLVDATAQSAFRVPMSSRDFYWGSNSVCANDGMLLIQAYRATGDAAYLKPAVDALDYLLGRNGPSISFVTGYGARFPLHPHHRPSVADDVAEPVPGFLVGGPNPGQQDKCAYPSLLPALSYSDSECNYASNEVAINWNAPLAYLSGALHALYSGAGGSQAIGPGTGRREGRRAALLTWEEDAPKLIMPEGLRGRLELFDGLGRGWSPARIRDSAKVGEKRPGLLFFRLQVEGKNSPVAAYAGSWATLSVLRIPLN